MSIALDNDFKGQILFLPYAHCLGVTGITLHFVYNRPNSLAAIFLSYALSVDKLQLGNKTSSNPTPTLGGNIQHKSFFREQNTKYQHGLRILGFSEELFLYVKNSSSDRTFCVWSARPGRKGPDLETRFLTAILEQAHALHVAHKDEARFVFVHVGALASLHKFARFAERRTKRDHIQFYLYGTDTKVSPDLLPVQEIYPCGLCFSH